jgi:ATP-binding cassette subfamily F protein 3
MLSVSKLNVSFGGESLFSDVSFLLNKGDRIGLVGKNGAGKSTLLKVISGKEEKETGELAMPSGATIGYLAQDITLQDGRTVREEAFTAFEELINLNKQQEEITLALTTRTDYESASYSELIEDMNTVNDRITILGGDTAAAQVEKVLFGLGFTSNDLDQPTSEFSGGWRMRVELAKLLLQKPDVLLLDEPTNHLDIESIIWLERFLTTYEGAIMLVSHDKAFLDNVTNRTIEISLGRIYDYKASYTKYLGLRKERREQQQLSQKNQEKEIKQTEQLIEKFRYKASKASFAQSLIKKLNRMDRIEVDEEDTKSMRFKFQINQQPGKVVLELDQIKKTYGDKKVLTGIDLLIERGDKVAFVGQNGQGKTTLARIIADNLSHEGDVNRGHNVEIAYFAQNQSELLDGDKTLLQTIEDAASKETFSKSRDLLGSFLFGGDAVEKKVKVLSGGEKGRLAMCKLLLHPANVLVLDEPTNHLDIRSKEILKQSIKNYEGTVILVSHDREFLDGLVDKVYEFKNGVANEYLGGIKDFLKQKSVQDFRSFEKQGIAKTSKSSTSKAESNNKLGYEERKQLDKDIKKFSNRLGKLESEIESLEELLAKWDVELTDPELFKKHSSDPNFYVEYDKKKERLAVILEDWENTGIKLDKLKTKRD